MKNDTGKPELLPGISCPGKMKVPTDREQECLKALKAIKEKASVVKERLASLKGSPGEDESPEIASLNRELSRLKSAWNEWDEKREKAAKERMILLGHEED